MQGHDVEPYFGRTLENVMQYWNVYEVIKAKYLKFTGLHLLRDENGEPRAAATEDREVLLRAKELLEQAKGFDLNVASARCCSVSLPVCGRW